MPGARPAPLDDPAARAQGAGRRGRADRGDRHPRQAVHGRRYGYRRIAALLRAGGWRVNAKRVERIWRREGPKVPRRQPKRRRLWLADGSRLRLRPERPNQVWAYDVVEERTHDGRKFRLLVVVDECSPGSASPPSRPVV